MDFGFEHGGEVVVDVAHEERRVDDDESPAGVLVKDLHSHLGGIERVGRLRAAPVLMPPPQPTARAAVTIYNIICCAFLIKSSDERY